MGRLIKATTVTVTPAALRKTTEGNEAPAGGEEPTPPEKKVVDEGDTYLERVAKYVPAEVVAFYFFANSILKQSAADTLQRNAAAKIAGNVEPGEIAKIAGFPVELVGWYVFLLAWVCVFFYIWRVAQSDEAIWTNAFVSMVIFPVWAYAVGGVGLDRILAYDGHFASILLGAATLISGLVTPRDKPVA